MAHVAPDPPGAARSAFLTRGMTPSALRVVIAEESPSPVCTNRARTIGCGTSNSSRTP